MTFIDTYKQIMKEGYEKIVYSYDKTVGRYEYKPFLHANSDSWKEDFVEVLINNLLNYCYEPNEIGAMYNPNIPELRKYINKAIKDRLNRKTKQAQQDGLCGELLIDLILRMENENNEIGVAKTLLSVKDEDICIIEMGMRAKGEIGFLSEICKPETSVITNCGSAHIGMLGTKDDIFKAKTEILEHTTNNCVIPYENRFLKCKKYGLNAIFVGNRGNIESESVEYNKEGSAFSVFENNKLAGRIFLPSLSEYNVTNSLFAYSVGRLYGVEHNEIKNGLKNFKNIGYRERILKIAEITFVLDCYNASYEGMKEAIKGFCESLGFDIISLTDSALVDIGGIIFLPFYS